MIDDDDNDDDDDDDDDDEEEDDDDDVPPSRLSMCLLFCVKCRCPRGHIGDSFLVILAVRAPIWTPTEPKVPQMSVLGDFCPPKVVLLEPRLCNRFSMQLFGHRFLTNGGPK